MINRDILVKMVRILSLHSFNCHIMMSFIYYEEGRHYGAPLENYCVKS